MIRSFRTRIVADLFPVDLRLPRQRWVLGIVRFGPRALFGSARCRFLCHQPRSTIAISRIAMSAARRRCYASHCRVRNSATRLCGASRVAAVAASDLHFSYRHYQGAGASPCFLIRGRCTAESEPGASCTPSIRVTLPVNARRCNISASPCT